VGAQEGCEEFLEAEDEINEAEAVEQI